jgi:very-short-patch-repair endonuclease
MKIVKIPDIIKETARKLRQNMTNSEIILWNKLKTKKIL